MKRSADDLAIVDANKKYKSLRSLSENDATTKTETVPPAKEPQEPLLPVPLPPAQVLPTQVPPTQVLQAQVPPVQVPPAQVPPAQVLPSPQYEYSGPELSNYLAGENGGFVEFQNNNEKIAGIFNLFKVMADGVHDFAKTQFTELYPDFSKTGDITKYHEALHRKFKTISQKISGSDKHLQDIFWNNQFNPNVKIDREREALKNTLRQTMKFFPQKMEKSYTIIGFIVVNLTDTGSAEFVEKLKILQSDGKDMFKIINNWKGEPNRVCIVRNKIYDAGNEVPIFVDVSTGKKQLFHTIFGHDTSITDIDEDMKQEYWYVPENTKNTIPFFFLDPATNVGSKGIPLVELDWVNTEENREKCYEVLDSGLTYYFKYILIPLITAAPTDDGIVIDVKISRDNIKEVLDRITSSPDKTRLQFNPELSLKFTVQYDTDSFEFEVVPYDNTITNIVDILSGSEESVDFLQNLNDFFQHVWKKNGSKKALLVDVADIENVAKKCFFFAIKGLGDWIQSYYNARILRHLRYTDEPDRIPTTGILQTGDKFVLLDVIFDGQLIAWNTSLQAANFFSNDTLNEKFGVELYPNMQFVQLIDFKEQRYNSPLWKKIKSKIRLFFPNASIPETEIATPEDAYRCIEETTTLIDTKTYNIFTTTVDDKINVFLPAVNDTFETTLTYSGVTQETNINKVLELMQLDIDIQAFNNDMSTKIDNITTIITRFTEKYKAILYRFQTMIDTTITFVDKEKSKPLIRQNYSNKLYSLLQAKLSLLKKCSSFFKDTNLEQILVQIYDVEQIYQNKILEIRKSIPHYTSSDRLPSIEALKVSTNAFNDVIQKINIVIVPNIETQIREKIEEQDVVRQKLIASGNLRAPRHQQKELGSNIQKNLEQYPEMVTIAEELDRMLQKTIGGFLETNREESLENLNDFKKQIEDEQDKIATECDAQEDCGDKNKHLQNIIKEADTKNNVLQNEAVSYLRSGIMGGGSQKGGDDTSIKQLIQQQQNATLGLNNNFTPSNKGVVVSFIEQEIIHLELCFMVIDNILDEADRIFIRDSSEMIDDGEMVMDGEREDTGAGAMMTPSTPRSTMQQQRYPTLEPMGTIIEHKKVTPVNRTGGKGKRRSPSRKHKNRNKTRKRKRQHKYTKKKGQKKRVQTRPRRKRRQKKYTRK